MKLFDKVLLSHLGSKAAWPTKETVSNLSEPADSELEEDPLEVNVSVSLNFT